MDDKSYKKLAMVLDCLPNGFPATDDGIEIELLKKIFSSDEAELFCDLKLSFETPEQIAERTGRPLEGLQEKLSIMMEKGQVFGVELGETKMFKMVPWVFGIYEFQRPHMDREFAQMSEEYNKIFGPQFFSNKPQLMQVIPIETQIKGAQEALPYERVSNIIENSQSMIYFDCICKKERNLIGSPCDRPVEVCTAYAPIQNAFDNYPHGGTSMTKEEAYQLLNKAEEKGLVHLTWNVKNGHFFICNCCSCCCGVLRSINELGIDASKVINAHYSAKIDQDECTACGLCADERCQVNAIDEEGDIYSVNPEKCIGCGLCSTACPTEAISLIRKSEDQIDPPPDDEMDWFKKRADIRGIDISKYT